MPPKKSNRSKKQTPQESSKKGKGFKPIVCPLTLEEFLACTIVDAAGEEKPLPLEVTYDGNFFIAEPKEFKTGSFGFFGVSRFHLKFRKKRGGYVTLPCQAILNVVLLGSGQKEQDEQPDPNS